jgi:hypothetical protein
MAATLPSWAALGGGESLSKGEGSTADCDDIDPYARQCHALHCGHALLRLLSGRDGGEYRWSALW